MSRLRLWGAWVAPETKDFDSNLPIYRGKVQVAVLLNVAVFGQLRYSEMFLGRGQEKWNDKVMEQRGHKSSTEDKRQAVILRCAQVSHSVTLKLGSLWRL